MRQSFSEATVTAVALLARVGVLLLVFLAVMSIFRGVFYWNFADRASADAYGPYLARAFVMGARFDLKTLAALQLPATLALLAGLALRRAAYWRNLAKGLTAYYTAGFGLLSAVAAIDQAFYSYFQDHINFMIFGLVEDDTAALFKGFAKDYNLPLIFLLAAVYFAGVFFLTRRILRRVGEEGEPRWRAHAWLGAALVVLIVPANALALRGNLGLKPLGVVDTEISPILFVNQLAQNGPYALLGTLKLRLRASGSRDVIADLGYEGDEARAFSELLGRKVDLPAPDSWRALVTSRTLANPRLEASKPHVVLVIMESFGGFMMKYQSESFDILGALAHHLDDGILFPNFLPADNGTVGSLSSLMVNMPVIPGTPYLPDSSYLGAPFLTGAGRPFREAGYETSFVYGGRTNWRYVDRFVAAQGFDHVEGSAAIRQAVAFGIEGIETYWGVYDEYLLEYLSLKLARAAKPQFIVALTTSNHPPYDIPEGAAVPLLDLPPRIRQRMVGNADLMAKRFRSYWYASDALGRWISEQERAPHRDRMIIAVTGDHNVGGLVTFSEEEMLDWRSVPFLLHIPPALMPDAPIDRSTFASHSDVMPTLYHLALSDRPYLAVGVDLLDPARPHVAINAAGIAMSRAGAVVSGPGALRGFRWSVGEPGRLVPAAMAPDLSELSRYRRAALVVSEYVTRAHKPVLKTRTPREP